MTSFKRFQTSIRRNSLEPCLGEPVVLLFRPQISRLRSSTFKYLQVCYGWKAPAPGFIVEDVSIWVFLMIGKLFARHLMMFQMTSSFQPVMSRRERSQPPRKSMSNNCERFFSLHLIILLQPERCKYACLNCVKFARYFKKYCSQCHSIYPDNRITRVRRISHPLYET